MNKSLVLVVGAIIFVIMMSVLFGCQENRRQTNFIPASEMTPEEQPLVAVIGIGRTFPEEIIASIEKNFIKRGMRVDTEARFRLSAKDMETFPFASIHRRSQALYLLTKMKVDTLYIMSVKADGKPYVLWIQERDTAVVTGGKKDEKVME